MQDLIKKIEDLKDLVKSLLAKPGQNSLVPALRPPTVKPVSMPKGGSTAPTEIPGVTPPSGKDPAKVAQQLKNPRPKKPRMDMLKFNESGQWSLEKDDTHSVLTTAGFNKQNYKNPDLHVYARKTSAGHNEFISLNSHDGKWEHQAKPGINSSSTKHNSVEAAIAHADKIK